MRNPNHDLRHLAPAKMAAVLALIVSLLLLATPLSQMQMKAQVKGKTTTPKAEAPTIQRATTPTGQDGEAPTRHRVTTER